MSELLQKIHWKLIGRVINSKRFSGFWASIWSFSNNECTFSPNVRIYRDARLINVKIGRMTYVSEGAKLGFCEVGSFVSIGPDSIVGGLGSHPTNFISTHPAFYSTRCQTGLSFVEQDVYSEIANTKVGHDVWIGARAVILDGCILGDGCIIAAGAIVTKDVAPYSVVGGVPAKFIKWRFSQEIIDELMSFQWWNIPTDQLAKYSREFCQADNLSISKIELLKNLTKEN